MSQLSSLPSKYVIHESACIFEGIETALENRAYELIVIDRENKPVGRFNLDVARRAVKDGRYFSATVSDVVQPLESPGVLSFSLDSFGAISKIEPNFVEKFLPVAEPTLGKSEFRNLLDAFLSTWISSTGEYLRGFEHDFASYVGKREGVAVTNGTVSLHLALLAIGIGPGDEVIVPDLTFAATINTVIMTGATPVIVDVDSDSWCLSARQFAAAITKRTRAVIPVHVFGRIAEMPEIARTARENGIYVIEDCAEAHGAAINGRQVGTFSDIASFSFFANKIITTGEGGMCITDNKEFASRMRVLRDHGMRPERRYWHEEVGYNYRMTNIAAAIGSAQLEKIEAIIMWRKALTELYKIHLNGITGIEFPVRQPDGYSPVPWFVCVLVPAEKRASIIEAGKRANIDIRPFFNSLSSMPAYRQWARPCETSSRLASSGLNLPTSHRIGEEEVKRVAAIMSEALSI